MILPMMNRSKQPYYSVRDQAGKNGTFKNQVRQNVDYSVLFFIIFWGLNVADAAVDAHLKTFDVSDELAYRSNWVFLQWPNKRPQPYCFFWEEISNFATRHFIYI